MKHADLVAQSQVLQLKGRARTEIEDRVARNIVIKMGIAEELKKV